jgi:GT2 family glycosyltransferase
MGASGNPTTGRRTPGFQSRTGGRPMDTRLGSAPKVSIIVPCYNYGRFLGQAIESVLAQSFSDFELIVCDDGSTDGTRDVACSYQDNRIAYHYQRNRGFPSAHNLGLKKARGKYLCILDADDWWLIAEKLAYQYAVMERDTTVVMTYARACLYWDGGRYVDNRIPRPKGQIFRALLLGDFVPLGTIMVRTDVARQVGFDERVPYMQDYPFKLRVAALGRVHFWDEAVMAYRQHPESVSTSRTRLRENAIEVLNVLRTEMPAGLTPARTWRQALSRQHLECGKEFEMAQNRARASRHYWSALTQWPLNWKAAVLMVGLLLGGLLKLARLMAETVTQKDV